MTETYIRRAEVPDYDALAIRKMTAVGGRGNFELLTHSGAACEFVPAAEAGHRAKVR